MSPPRAGLLFALLGCLGLFFGSGTALAQASWPVSVLVPEVLSLRMPDNAIAFDVADAYPPPEFPHTYPGGTLPLQFHASTEGSWTISLEIGDLTDADGALLVPAEQVHYRVNGGTRLSGSGFPEIIHSGTGPTNGWFEITVEFELELTGAERAGAYTLDLTVTAETEEF